MNGRGGFKTNCTKKVLLHSEGRVRQGSSLGGLSGFLKQAESCRQFFDSVVQMDTLLRFLSAS